MKKILFTIGFIFFFIENHYSFMNYYFEQQKNTPVVQENTTSSSILKEDKKIINCFVSGVKVKVSHVTDGDTFNFICKNKSFKVRVIGIDTPETKHPNKDVECFGIEASSRMKKLINGKEVTLYKGKGTDNTDKYGRLLRYIDLDGEDIGLKLINEGYAFSYKRFPHERLDIYNYSEKISRENNVGLWDSSTCNY